MDILQLLLHGFATAGTPVNLMWAFVGCALGTAIGVLPGIGPAVTVAMLLPITAQVEPTASMIFFAGIYYGAMYGGSTTSILLNTPGETGTMVTALEGFKMAKHGRAGAALATAAIGSFVAGTIATVLVTLFAPVVARYAVLLGPPEYFCLMLLAFTTVALGGFRGLISNALWIRLNDLQLDEKYFEMVQLSDWITKMQPHFVAVWVHQAWNLSYNISVKFPDPNDRWFWVNRGIELLRDEALRYNPNETLIYRELAWHFQHKMGANLDNAHMTYKREWMRLMTEVLGSHGKPNWDGLLNPQTDDARARAKLLREKYKLDPKLMQEVDGKYGPLEWRLPETHAIYWAYLRSE